MPSPPSDEEKYWYFGRQHRWLLWVQASSFVLIAVSVLRFSTSDARLLLFLVPMSLFTITLVVSLLSSTRTRRTSRADHELRVNGYDPAVYPSVDVFLPSAGEPLDVLVNTYRHVARLSWPGPVEVWVLDDAARTEVANEAAAHGFHYRTRPDRGRLKKAGNLRYGYENTSADLIMILDADFVPRPDFLRELVPYFDDPTVGIVQSPQFFDARKGQSWLQRCAGATQELFYRWIQPARDRSKAAICVGSCAVYRRAALQRAGGFAQIGHSEDVHTGVNLMKAGFHLRYVPILVSKGLCPDTLHGFLNQQYRWCTGSMSLLADPDFHNDRHISARQRLAFWAGFLYYISTAVNVFVMSLPAVAMLWLLPAYVFPHNSAYLLGALSLWTVILPAAFRGRWRLDVLRVQTLYSYAHAVAIWHVLTRRTKEWVATGTANSGTVTPLAVTISRVMRAWVALTQVLIWAGLARGIAEYGIHRFWAMLFFAAVGAYVQVPLLFLRGTPKRVGGTVAPSSTDPASISPQADDDRHIGPSDQFSITNSHIGHRTAAEKRTRTIPTRNSRDKATGVPADRSAGLHRPVPSAENRRPRAWALRRLRGIPATRPPQRPSGAGASAAETGAAANGRTFRYDIQGLRAVAVLAVVLYHAHVPLVRGGYIGVDVFFVISGFLITGQLLAQVKRDGKLSIARFYAARFRRLAAPAALVVVVTLILARLWDSLFSLRPLSVDALTTSVYALNYRLAEQGINYQQASAPPSPLQHYWSLAVEEQFYLLWPAVIMLCVWLARRHHRRVLALLVTAAIVGSVYLCVRLTSTDQPMAYFSIQTRAWELGAGAALALLSRRLRRTPAWLAAAFSWAGLVTVVATALLYTDDTPFPGTAAIVVVAGTAAIIAAGCRPHRGGALLALGRRPMQGIGKVSYAWYLWHWPLLILIPMKLGHDLSWSYQVEVCVLALWAAVLSYHLLENPSRRSRLRWPAWLGAGPAATALSATAAVLLVVSLPTLAGSGEAVATVRLNSASVASIHTALVKALAKEAVPANLTPSLAGVSGDQPASTANGCHADYLVVHQGSCVFGDPLGNHTLVLYGDSHAQQWLPALDSLGRELHWKVVAWTKAACPVADVHVFSDVLNREYRECDRWRSITAPVIVGLHPDMILVSQSDNVIGDRVSNSEWADATAGAVRALSQSGASVDYLLDTPVASVANPDCVANNLTRLRRCDQSRKDIYYSKSRHELMAQTLHSAGIQTIEPVNWFCAAQCPAVVANMLVYRDGSHMSTTYSTWLAPMLKPMFVTRR